MPRLLKSKLPFILLNVFSVVLACILIYSTYYILTTYKTLLLYKTIKESYESSLYRAIETFRIYTKTENTKDMVLTNKYLDNALNYIGTIGNFDDIYKSTDEESRLELLILVYANVMTEEQTKELIRYTNRIYRLYEGEEEFINMFQGNKALYEHTLNLRKDINGYVLNETRGSENVSFEKDKLKGIGITLSKIHAKVDVLDKSLDGLVLRSYKYLINSALVVLVFFILTPVILYILWRRRIEGSIISLYNYMLRSYKESKLSLNEVVRGGVEGLDMVDVEGVGGGVNGHRKGIKKVIEKVYRNGRVWEHKYNFDEVQDIFSNVLTKATSMSSAMKVLYGGKEKLRITFAVLFEKTNTLLKGVIVDTEDISLSLKKLDGSLISLDKSFIKVLDYTKKTYEGEARRVDSLYGAKRLAEGVYKSLASTLALVGDKLDRSHEFYKGASVVDKEIRDTVSIIKKVSDSAHVIYELINVINVIAEQTDLLAMNAAIEAAHAGEAGRGFGVVSEEIRKLAENTAKNSQEISRSLDEIIVDIKASEEITRDTGEVILNLFRNVKEVLESMFLMRDGMSKSLEDSKELIEILLSGRENIELGDRGKLDIKEQIERIEGGVREGIEMVEQTKERVDGLVGNANILLEVLSRGCDEVWVDFTRFER